MGLSRPNPVPNCDEAATDYDIALESRADAQIGRSSVLARLRPERFGKENKTSEASKQQSRAAALAATPSDL
eukprot:6213549-Pleurochrysis_carterae.AAC.1